MLSQTIEGKTGESKIASGLSEILTKHKNIDIGSYPAFKNGVPSVALVVRSTDPEALKKAVNDVVVLLNDVDADPHIVSTY